MLLQQISTRTAALFPYATLFRSQVLYHWRSLEGSVALSADGKSSAHDRGRQALVEHFARRRVAATVEEVPVGRYRRVRYPLPDPAPRVSVIVPTRDRVELLRTAVGSLLEKTDYPDIEEIGRASCRERVCQYV